MWASAKTDLCISASSPIPSYAVHSGPRASARACRRRSWTSRSRAHASASAQDLTSHCPRKQGVAKHRKARHPKIDARTPNVQSVDHHADRKPKTVETHPLRTFLNAETKRILAHL